MVKKYRGNRLIRAGPRFIEFRDLFKKRLEPYLPYGNIERISDAWLTDKMAEILDEGDFINASVRQLERRRRRKR
jgi:hypothetical protein